MPSESALRDGSDADFELIETMRWEPALSCGLLPGVLRSELIALGKAREATLGPHDLRAAEELFVGNSLRGLIRARLA